MNKILHKLQLQIRIRFNTSYRGANPGEGVFFVTGRWVYNLGGLGGGGAAKNGKTYKWKFTVCLKNDT